MIEMYKSLLGGYREIDESHDGTHMMMTSAEYEKFNKELNDLRMKVMDYKRDYDDMKDRLRIAKESLKFQYDQKIEKTKESYESLLKHQDDVYHEELEKLKEKAEKAASTNNNLVRIMRENSNAKRGLTPKKERSGYQVMSVQQYEYIYQEDILDEPGLLGREPKYHTESATYNCYRMVLQTPIESYVPLDNAMYLIDRDMNGPIGKSLGVKWRKEDYYDIEDPTNRSGKNENWVFNVKLKANYRTGFVEVDCLVCGPLSIPVEMQPVQQRN